MPEKGLTEIPRALREQYEKGVAAIQRDNLDYALTILTAVLQQEPGFYPAREALRDAQFRRTSKRGGFLRKMLGAAGNSPLLAKAQIELRVRPKEALQTAEQVLNSDANSVAAHKIIAAAATTLDFPKTALFSLQFAFKRAPEKDIALQLSQALARAGQIGRAESVLSDLVETFPNDQELAQALKDLAAKRTMSEGGYGALEGGGGSYRDILKDKDEAEALERDNRAMRSDDATARVLRDYEARLAEEPRNTRILRSMAELHTQAQRHDEALDCYQRIIEIEGVAEPSLQKAVTAVHLRRFDDRLAALDSSDPEATEVRRQLEEERHACEVDRARKLIEHYPNDLGLHHELGEILFRQGRIAEAIQEFQKSQNHPHKRVQALYYLGRCFEKRGIRDLATRTLETAIREKSVFDDEKKALVYALAGVLEGAGKKAEAIEQLKLIYEIDIGYRDVAARVDAHYTAGSG